MKILAILVVVICAASSQKFSEECPSGSYMEEITSELEEYILEMHNGFRNEIASGRTKPYKKAIRMACLEWDDDLAKLAAKHLKKCDFDIVKSPGTKKFKAYGQTIDRTISKKKFAAPKSVIRMMITRWFNDHKNGDMSYIEKYRPHDSDRRFENFAQLVRDEAYVMGCAMARLPGDGEFTTLFKCNYSVMLFIDEPVYKSGTKRASGCKKGNHKDYPALCSVKEVYKNP